MSFGVDQVIWILVPIGVLLGFLAGKGLKGEKTPETPSDSVVKPGSEESYLAMESHRERLVHQERFAALGRLVAGIAHEIRNPLNFINNFAELTAEMIEECRQYLEGHREHFRAEDLKTLADALEQLSGNVDRIQNHGVRASAIVGRVLEQARDSAGERRAIDINALVEEYADLIFFGQRARHPEMKQVLEKRLDPDLPRIQVDPQDFSRAILNLIDNGFYAAEKRLGKEDADFRPKVIVSTKLNGDSVDIAVDDNGFGIPEDVRARIFEPFFTTKPVGEGTGLGLSMSRDIVEAHGGSIQMNSVEGEGTRVSIRLPLELANRVRLAKKPAV